MSTTDPLTGNKYPEACVPYLDTTIPNESRTLYTGEMQLSADGIDESGEEEIELSWLPRPCLRFRCRVNSRSGIEWIGARGLQVSLAGEHSHDSSTADVTSAAAFSTDELLPIGGIVESWTRGPELQIESVVAHFVNLRQFRGEVIQHDRATYVGRASLETSEWIIEIDEIYKPDFFKRLKSQQAFGITHAAKIRRKDGSAFCLDDLEEFITCLNFFCSFTNGDWCGPIWFVGVDTSGNQVSHVWRVPRVDGYRDNHNWFSPVVEKSLPGLFPGFVDLWNDEVWQESLRNTIFWYVTAMSAGMSIENSIVLCHIAFETLGWTYFVEYKKSISSQGFEKLQAADKLRLLLSQLDIPVAFPSRFSALSGYASAENHEDVATTLSRLRNAYVHPSPKNRGKLNKVGIQAQYEARTMCLHYLELIVLRLCQYNGDYSCRITDAEWRGGEVRPVPWGAKS
ncbi:hypothetical protein [Rosistilla oblonga]|uniref:hypothetical protein n=1 Tax=Rosistilla oblonga TaxID=2527990 RepID=UPI003A9739FC